MAEQTAGRPPSDVLADLATRAAVASRLRSASEDRLLQSILDAAVALFRAGAGSMALVLGEPERLEFVAAAGPRAEGVVGRSMGVGEGLAGYVVQTGEAIALAHPTSDPRFGRGIAAQTGFMPESLMAVPLRAVDSVVGVIEILDCRDGSFDSDAIALASIFARQAAIAIESTRIEREFPVLVARVLDSYGIEAPPEFREAVAALPNRTSDDFWELVDEIATLSDASPRMRGFIADLLPVAGEHLSDAPPRRARR
jgi:GAF domain-containing protein